MTRYTPNVNGTDQRAEVSAVTPLLWMLHEHLGLIGTKFGCGIGHCGACVVHLDGAPVNSCMIPVVEVTAKQITTIEDCRHPATILCSRHGSPDRRHHADIASPVRS